MPQPYLLRDWADIARKYDTFVYDLEATGDHLPLIFIHETGVNYPDQKSFGLDSYVGTVNAGNGEAINVLPSLVGATLVGIDKSDQDGNNWILYSQDYFNKQNGELIYLNGRSSGSGNDWWYDMMPNVYFYQLYDLYGNMGDAEYQFTTVADRYAQAVRGLGGSETPWQRANMQYRAWDFVEMKPNDTGVPEPEAAGAFAWVLYHAYSRTGNPEHLKAAEWSMEFLNALGSNPSYELQLPYGCFAAAKMNAQLGTRYQLDKMLFWVFNRGPLRGWGTVVDTWGGLDVSGLVGEANETGNDYVFQMNGVQHAAALVPMVRYDKRYARAIAKWVLNLANATRFMFPGYLPAAQQDASDWSQQYDPEGVIGYEAMREMQDGFSPFATGDAVKGGWAATNLALYGTSSIGYLGAMINETEIERILLIDVLKTDFFKDTSYPTYLVYNPYEEEKTVTLDVGSSQVDIYDALTESFILQQVQGNVQVTIPPDETRLLVYAPSGLERTYRVNKFLIGNVVVDYWQNAEPYNFRPRIQSLAVLNSSVEYGDSIELFSSALDYETKDLEYLWTTDIGEILDSGEIVSYVAPGFEGEANIRLIVVDEAGLRDTSMIQLHITPEVNLPPRILNLKASKSHVAPSKSITITCEAIDDNNDPLNFNWSVNGGTIGGEGTMINWTAPASEGIFTIGVIVNDDAGGSVSRAIEVLVRDFSTLPEANLIAYYPFSGDAQDISGNALHGSVSGAKLTQDFDGNPTSAYFFDGNNDRITVANTPILNVESGITVTADIQPLSIGTKERFILSHGSWQNRWKISITPEGYLRWTVKYQNGSVADLDSKTLLLEDSVYHVAASYEGQYLLLFINGVLESFRPQTGSINPSPVDFLMGQILPDDTGYNYHGNLDEVRLFDAGLHPSEIEALAGVSSSTNDLHSDKQQRKLIRAFPNPTNGRITLKRMITSGQTERQYWHIELVAIEGLPILRQTMDHDTLHLDISDIPTGQYFLVVRSAEGVQIERILKL